MNSNLQIALMAILLGVLAVGSYFFQRWLWTRYFEKHPPRVRPLRDSIKCPPEYIRPPQPQRGNCYITGCKIQQEHCHAEALRKRLNEDRNK